MKIVVVRREHGVWIDLVAETGTEKASLTTLLDTVGREQALNVPLRIESFGCDPDDDEADLSDPTCPIHSIRLETDELPSTSTKDGVQ